MMGSSVWSHPILLQSGSIQGRNVTELTLRSVMYTMPVAFRLQPVNKPRYSVRPQSGIIPPLVTLTVEIVYHLPPGSMLPDKFAHCDDSFLLRSVVVPGVAIKDPLSTFDAVPNEWFMTRKKQVFIDSGTKVMFVGSSVLVHLVIDGAMDEIRKSRSGSTPLEAAATAGEALIVELLLAHKAWTERSSNLGPIHLAAGGPFGSGLSDEQTVKLLLQKGANKEIRNKLGKTAFDVAAEYGYARLFDTLKLRDNFCVAARKGETRTLQRLIKNGVVINGRDQNGWTALHRASFKGKLEAVRVLIDNGVDIEAKDEEGYTDVTATIGVPFGNGKPGKEVESKMAEMKRRAGRARVLRGSFDRSSMAPVAVL
ncbi:hypothetical protein SLEP1_g43832 [Rubroshorea leprosula]|uniref:MSP domain-containing protein n=1 Tax=Rubroshorea leprosula TaxID=152421 RepID=A0AAV5LEA3_9ROSI|nr:hypothetical protein SLEP1_g43832 [Rubroshorea leprosula]